MSTEAPSPQTPATPAAPPKKSSVLPKVLVGCLGLIVLVGIAISVVGWWASRKIGHFAELAQKNPAALGARLLVASNPDLEIVSEDDGHQTVTIHNKKTGDVVTVNASDLKQGKLKLKNAKGEEVVFDGAAGKEGGVKVTTKEGTTTIGSSAGTAPSWVPSYPGAQPAAVVSKQSAGGGVEGLFTFVTGDPAEKVLDLFASELKGKGFQVERTDMKGDGGNMGTVAAKASKERREVNVTAVPSDKGTQVSVQYKGAE
jgi:hypothetical protein